MCLNKYVNGNKLGVSKSLLVDENPPHQSTAGQTVQYFRVFSDLWDFHQRYGTVLTFSMLNHKHKLKHHSKVVATQPIDKSTKRISLVNK